MRSVLVGLVAVLLVSTAWGQEKLDLSGPDTTDEVLAEKLKGLTNLKVLSLSGTKITDAGPGTSKTLSGSLSALRYRFPLRGNQ